MKIAFYSTVEYSVQYALTIAIERAYASSKSKKDMMHQHSMKIMQAEHEELLEK